MNRWVRVLLAVVLLALLAGSATAARQVGQDSRKLAGPALPVAEATATLVPTPLHAYRLWQQRGTRGRVVVHLGRFFGYQAVEANLENAAVGRFRPASGSLLGYFEQTAKDENFMWLATRGRRVREIYNVVPEALFAAKRDHLLAAKPDSSISELSESRIVGRDHDLRRTTLTSLPPLDEPVLLHVEASFFAAADARSVYLALQESGLQTDLVTLCLSEGHPQVTDAQRTQVLELARLFRAVTGQ